MIMQSFGRRGLLTRCVESQNRLVMRQQSARSFSVSSERRSTDPKKLEEDFNYCVNLVRERDREGFCECLHRIVLLLSLNVVFSP